VKLCVEKRTRRYPLDEGMRELNCNVIQGEHAMEWLDEEVALPTDLFSAQACTRGNLDLPADTPSITVQVRHNLLHTMSVDPNQNASPKLG